jgi:hypothetical protein
MPDDPVLVRHGQSEANIVQKWFKRDPQATAPDGFFDRHDEWVVDVRWRERDWGEFGVLNQVERVERFALHYTRRDPASGRIDPKIRWMRSIYPWDETASWHGGRWIEIHRRHFSDDELMELVSRYPLLLGDDEPVGPGPPR